VQQAGIQGLAFRLKLIHEAVKIFPFGEKPEVARTKR
jgi:hypothetical protein